MDMTSWPDLEPMPNKLVNYGVTDNGIAIIELISDTDGKPLEEGRTSVNTYTREMWEDIDQAILNARFDGNVSVILLTGHGEKFFSAGASINYLNTLSPLPLLFQLDAIILRYHQFLLELQEKLLVDQFGNCLCVQFGYQLPLRSRAHPQLYVH